MNSSKDVQKLFVGEDGPVELSIALEKLSALIGFEYFNFVQIRSTSGSRAEIFSIDNYPDSWKKYYQEKGCISWDPALEYARSNYLPICWRSLLNHRQWRSEQIELVDEAYKHGLATGFSLPVRGVVGQAAKVSFSTASLYSASDDKLLDAMALAQLAVPYIQEQISSSGSHLAQAASLLTSREIECLTWASEGKSAWEISQIVGCSEHTAIFHLRNASQKLGANNRYQAVVKALLAGVIEQVVG